MEFEGPKNQSTFPLNYGLLTFTQDAGPRPKPDIFRALVPQIMRGEVVSITRADVAEVTVGRVSRNEQDRGGQVVSSAAQRVSLA